MIFCHPEHSEGSIRRSKCKERLFTQSVQALDKSAIVLVSSGGRKYNIRSIRGSPLRKGGRRVFFPEQVHKSGEVNKFNMNKTDVINLLSKILYFSGLDSTALQLISEATLQHTYEEGQFVFMEGEPCIGLYVVEQGWARAVKISASGREQVIRFVGPGDVFNEVGVMAGGVNVVTVEAMEPLKLLIIQRDVLLDLVDQHPTLAKALIENLAKRVLYAMNLVAGLSLHSVESRLARFLLTQAKDNIISRKKWTTQAFIASRIGTVPVVVNRAFSSFVENDLIELERDQIQILNLQELQKIASLTE